MSRGGATDEEASDQDVLDIEEHSLLPGRVSILLAIRGEVDVLSLREDFGFGEAPLAVEEASGDWVSCFGAQNPDILRQS